MNNRYHLYSLVVFFFLCYHYVGSMIINTYEVPHTIIKIFYTDTRQIILTQEGYVYGATVNGTNATLIDGLSNVVKLHQYECCPNSFVARKVKIAYFSHDAFATLTESILPVYSIGYGLIHVAPFSPGVAFFETYLQVYTTSDSGDTWNGPYSGSQFEWSLDPDSANNLFMTSLPTRVTEGTIFSYTSTFGKTITPLFSNVTQTQTFVLTPSYIWIFNKNSSAMVSSVTSDRAHVDVESYKPALIPYAPSFFKLDDDSGDFVAIRDFILPITTIYYTPDNGATWNVSIENAALAADASSVSFNRVAEGVYLVNVANEGNGDETKVTKISYDNGITWGSLTMTETDNATDPDCYPQCTLFLRAKTADKKAFYTNPYSNGVIVSVGTIGSSTSTNLKTFISTNSARSWAELVNEETIYEVGANGTIIVWAPVTPTTVIWYSNDTGVTRQNWTISSSPVTVYNITTDGKGTNFAIYTSTARASNLVFAINVVNPIIPPDYTIGKGAAKAIRILFLIVFIFVVLYFVITKTPKLNNTARRLAGLPPKNYDAEEMMLPSH